MQRALKQRGLLMVFAPEAGADEQRCRQEAVSAYQRAREAFSHLTLLGEGAGCAYCLMLAERFSPDAIVLAPCIRTDAGVSAEEFLFAVRRCARGLYAVCAPVTVLLPEALNASDERGIKRLLKQLRSAEKRVQRFSGVEDIAKVAENMANRARTIKTLA